MRNFIFICIQTASFRVLFTQRRRRRWRKNDRNFPRLISICHLWSFGFDSNASSSPSLDTNHLLLHKNRIFLYALSFAHGGFHLTTNLWDSQNYFFQASQLKRKKKKTKKAKKKRKNFSSWFSEFLLAFSAMPKIVLVYSRSSYAIYTHTHLFSNEKK